ncbi:MAG: hypothetical protein GEV04_07260 [Actinophytocola sp.]|nr:hypothetical protein [Actinophytocola sp.]
MMDSQAIRGANAATGFVLSSLLVCGVIVVSDIGTYALPTVTRNVPLAEGALPGPLDRSAEPPRAATTQSITVPVTMRPRRETNLRGGTLVALPAPVVARADQHRAPGQWRTPDQLRTSDQRRAPDQLRAPEPRPGRGAVAADASRERPERGERASSRRGAMPEARDTREGRETAEARDRREVRHTSSERSAETFRAAHRREPEPHRHHPGS